MSETNADLAAAKEKSQVGIKAPFYSVGLPPSILKEREQAEGAAPEKTAPTADNDDDGFTFRPELDLGDNGEVIDPKAVKPADKPAETVETPKLNTSRFKEFIEKDEIGEDDIYETLKTLKSEKENLSIAAQGRKLIEEDKQIESWSYWAKQPNKEVLTANYAYQYQQDGLTAEQAAAKAQERVKKLDEDAIDDQARAIKQNLKTLIANRENEHLTKIKESSGSVSFIQPTEKLEKSAREALSKTEEFLGMKLSKDPAERKKVLDGALTPLSELNEALKDPAFLAKVMYLRKYEKQLTANVKSRTNGKATILDKLPKTTTKAFNTNTRTTPTKANVSGQRPKFSYNGATGKA
jgi:hypothetical protein